MAQKLEEQLRKSEETRRKMQEKAKGVKAGSLIPGSAAETYAKINEVKAIFKGMLEGKALEQMLTILNLAKQQTATVEELKQFNEEIDDLSGTMKNILLNLQGSHGLLVNLNKQMTAEFEARRQHRRQVQVAVSKLNKYLDNWL